MNVLVVKLSNEGFLHYQSEIVKIEPNKMLKELGDIIGCRYIDSVPYKDSYSIIVDDEGLLVSNNIVHELMVGGVRSDPMHLAGTLVFVKNEHTIDGMNFIGLSDSEIIDINENLKIKPVGITS